tara:strand:- start:2740 stop:3087 length:348 start_codon:yes stop_codon:yes gene_type:complete
MEQKTKILKAMLFSIENSGGFTLDKQASAPSEGYVVATETFIKQSFDATEPNDLARAIHTFFEGDHELIGGWLDGETLWVEASKVFDTPEQARQYCEAENEIAYFDLAKGQEVRI